MRGAGLWFCSLTPRPEPQQPPAAWRASPAPRGGPSHYGRRSPECASSSHSTACEGSAAPSSPPQTRRLERPAQRESPRGEFTRRRRSQPTTPLRTCLLAKMSRRASRSSFSVRSLASSLWASMSRSLWQLSMTNTTAAPPNTRGGVNGPGIAKFDTTV